VAAGSAAGSGSNARPAAKKKADGSRGFYERIFSLQVVLWYLLFQRLNADRTLAAVVQDVRAGGADRLGARGRKLSRRVRSTHTSAYNQARQRLPLALVQAALAHLACTLHKLAGEGAMPRVAPPPQRRTRQLFDGSTLAMLRTPELARAFPPASNQRGASDWCLMRIVVGFCAKTGGVLSGLCAAQQQSEQAMAWTVMEHAAAFTVWIGDRNFGVWSIAAQARRCHQDVLVRLTKSRALKLCAGDPLARGEQRSVDWKPTRHDQVPPGTECKAVTGRLIHVQIKKDHNYIDLWLFTTLPPEDYPLPLLVEWYGQRWQAELNFRYLKTQLKMEQLNVVSSSMAEKEFYVGLLAYSLVRAVMWVAGERLEQKHVAISFSAARRLVWARLMAWGRGQSGESIESWAISLLEEVALYTLPKRRKNRPNEPRRVRHRRQKFPPLKGSRTDARARDAETKSV
jgi:hypothetical protein